MNLLLRYLWTAVPSATPLLTPPLNLCQGMYSSAEIKTEGGREVLPKKS